MFVCGPGCSLVFGSFPELFFLSSNYDHDGSPEQLQEEGS